MAWVAGHSIFMYLLSLEWAAGKRASPFKRGCGMVSPRPASFALRCTVDDVDRFCVATARPLPMSPKPVAQCAMPSVDKTNAIQAICTPLDKLAFQADGWARRGFISSDYLVRIFDLTFSRSHRTIRYYTKLNFSSIIPIIK
jgi:hypothetical protein